MENSQPKVSICIPTYNHAHFLRNALDSALAQTFSCFELLVIDNCSTDNTEKIVADYALRDSRIKYHRNQLNIGAQNNLNRCIELAAGEYVKILCADDLLALTCVQKMVQVFEEHPNVSLVSSARVWVDRSLKPITILAYSRNIELSAGIDAVKRCLLHGNLIGEPTAVLFRKKDAIRGFNTKFRQLIDLEMWFYLLQKGDFAFLPEPLCQFRKHAGQQTRSNIQTLSFIEDGREILREYVTNKIHRRALYQRLWMIQVAFDVWAQLFNGVAFHAVHEKIKEIFPLTLFYLVLPFKIIAKLQRSIKGRIARL